MNWLYQPWPWWLSGALIAAIMLLLVYFGRSFGFSSNLRTLCAMAGAGRHVKFFDFDWKSQIWNLMFMAGALVGGFIAAQFLTKDPAVALSPATVSELKAYGFSAPSAMQPAELFSWQAVASGTFWLLALGGFLVGFGARYAGGCTSGHAISGLSNLQWPSLLAVVGFFIGGLLMTHVFFAWIFK
ncbi:MAG: YeeE/YedE thiosulfate transporter family protein [Chitinophagales bacterium]|nr:YeeE/YedE family protein [Chitinophagales bacterium]MDW8393822.1 YeeE/YedE thiosulfate transporter family protein [Chitinophagales bacterium]